MPKVSVKKRPIQSRELKKQRESAKGKQKKQTRRTEEKKYTKLAERQKKIAEKMGIAVPDKGEMQPKEYYKAIKTIRVRSRRRREGLDRKAVRDYRKEKRIKSLERFGLKPEELRGKTIKELNSVYAENLLTARAIAVALTSSGIPKERVVKKFSEKGLSGLKELAKPEMFTAKAFAKVISERTGFTPEQILRGIKGRTWVPTADSRAKTTRVSAPVIDGKKFYLGTEQLAALRKAGFGEFIAKGDKGIKPGSSERSLLAVIERQVTNKFVNTVRDSFAKRGGASLRLEEGAIRRAIRELGITPEQIATGEETVISQVEKHLLEPKEAVSIGGLFEAEKPKPAEAPKSKLEGDFIEQFGSEKAREFLQNLPDEIKSFDDAGLAERFYTAGWGEEAYRQLPQQIRDRIEKDPKFASDFIRIGKADSVLDNLSKIGYKPEVIIREVEVRPLREEIEKLRGLSGKELTTAAKSLYAEIESSSFSPDTKEMLRADLRKKSGVAGPKVEESYYDRQLSTFDGKTIQELAGDAGFHQTINELVNMNPEERQKAIESASPEISGLIRDVLKIEDIGDIPAKNRPEMIKKVLESYRRAGAMPEKEVSPVVKRLQEWAEKLGIPNASQLTSLSEASSAINKAEIGPLRRWAEELGINVPEAANPRVIRGLIEKKTGSTINAVDFRKEILKRSKKGLIEEFQRLQEEAGKFGVHIGFPEGQSSLENLSPEVIHTYVLQQKELIEKKRDEWVRTGIKYGLNETDLGSLTTEELIQRVRSENKRFQSKKSQLAKEATETGLNPKKIAELLKTHNLAELEGIIKERKQAFDAARKAGVPAEKIKGSSPEMMDALRYAAEAGLSLDGLGQNPAAIEGKVRDHLKAFLEPDEITGRTSALVEKFKERIEEQAKRYGIDAGDLIDKLKSGQIKLPEVKSMFQEREAKRSVLIERAKRELGPKFSEGIKSLSTSDMVRAITEEAGRRAKEAQPQRERILEMTEQLSPEAIADLGLDPKSLESAKPHELDAIEKKIRGEVEKQKKGIISRINKLIGETEGKAYQTEDFNRFIRGSETATLDQLRFIEQKTAERIEDAKKIYEDLKKIADEHPKLVDKEYHNMDYSQLSDFHERVTKHKEIKEIVEEHRELEKVAGDYRSLDTAGLDKVLGKLRKKAGKRERKAEKREAKDIRSIEKRIESASRKMGVAVEGVLGRGLEPERLEKLASGLEDILRISREIEKKTGQNPLTIKIQTLKPDTILAEVDRLKTIKQKIDDPSLIFGKPKTLEKIREAEKKLDDFFRETGIHLSAPETIREYNALRLKNVLSEETIDAFLKENPELALQFAENPIQAKQIFNLAEESLKERKEKVEPQALLNEINQVMHNLRTGRIERYDPARLFDYASALDSLGIIREQEVRRAFSQKTGIPEEMLPDIRKSDMSAQELLEISTNIPQAFLSSITDPKALKMLIEKVKVEGKKVPFFEVAKELFAGDGKEFGKALSKIKDQSTLFRTIQELLPEFGKAGVNMPLLTNASPETISKIFSSPDSARYFFFADATEPQEMKANFLELFGNSRLDPFSLTDQAINSPGKFAKTIRKKQIDPRVGDELVHRLALKEKKAAGIRTRMLKKFDVEKLPDDLLLNFVNRTTGAGFQTVQEARNFLSADESGLPVKKKLRVAYLMESLGYDPASAYYSIESPEELRNVNKILRREMGPIVKKEKSIVEIPELEKFHQKVSQKEELIISIQKAAKDLGVAEDRVFGTDFYGLQQKGIDELVELNKGIGRVRKLSEELVNTRQELDKAGMGERVLGEIPKLGVLIENPKLFEEYAGAKEALEIIFNEGPAATVKIKGVGEVPATPANLRRSLEASLSPEVLDIVVKEYTAGLEKKEMEREPHKKPDTNIDDVRFQVIAEMIKDDPEAGTHIAKESASLSSDLKSGIPWLMGQIASGKELPKLEGERLHRLFDFLIKSLADKKGVDPEALSRDIDLRTFEIMGREIKSEKADLQGKIRPTGPEMGKALETERSSVIRGVLEGLRSGRFELPETVSEKELLDFLVPEFNKLEKMREKLGEKKKREEVLKGIQSIHEAEQKLLDQVNRKFGLNITVEAPGLEEVSAIEGMTDKRKGKLLDKGKWTKDIMEKMVDMYTQKVRGKREGFLREYLKGHLGVTDPALMDEIVRKAEGLGRKMEEIIEDQNLTRRQARTAPELEFLKTDLLQSMTKIVRKMRIVEGEEILGKDFDALSKEIMKLKKPEEVIGIIDFGKIRDPAKVEELRELAETMVQVKNMQEIPEDVRNQRITDLKNQLQAVFNDLGQVPAGRIQTEGEWTIKMGDQEIPSSFVSRNIRIPVEEQVRQALGDLPEGLAGKPVKPEVFAGTEALKLLEGETAFEFIKNNLGRIWDDALWQEFKKAVGERAASQYAQAGGIVLSEVSASGPVLKDISGRAKQAGGEIRLPGSIKEQIPAEVRKEISELERRIGDSEIKAMQELSQDEIKKLSDLYFERMALDRKPPDDQVRSQREKVQEKIDSLLGKGFSKLGKEEQERYRDLSRKRIEIERQVADKYKTTIREKFSQIGPEEREIIVKQKINEQLRKWKEEGMLENVSEEYLNKMVQELSKREEQRLIDIGKAAEKGPFIPSEVFGEDVKPEEQVELMQDLLKRKTEMEKVDIDRIKEESNKEAEELEQKVRGGPGGGGGPALSPGQGAAEMAGGGSIALLGRAAPILLPFALLGFILFLL